MLDYTLPVLAYLFGSISSAIIVCRILGYPDPRTTGSNNPGATNVLRIASKGAAITTLIGDFLKGLIPVLISLQLTSDTLILALVGFGAFLGHLFPLFFQFKGGKGVATAIGVFSGISWQLALCLFLIWLAVAVTTRLSSLAALTATALAPVIIFWLLMDNYYVLVSILIGLFLFWRHRENIRRLRNGTETKINLGKKS
jgi:glycerol-3-phosphate acyltransferase PlsY